MEDITMNEEIRTLQKNGEFHFPKLNREESRKAAEALARLAMQYDRKHGIPCRYGVARDAFGYYYTAVVEMN